MVNVARKPTGRRETRALRSAGLWPAVPQASRLPALDFGLWTLDFCLLR